MKTLLLTCFLGENCVMKCGKRIDVLVCERHIEIAIKHLILCRETLPTCVPNFVILRFVFAWKNACEFDKHERKPSVAITGVTCGFQRESCGC